MTWVLFHFILSPQVELSVLVLTLRGVVVLALLPQDGVRGLLQRRVQAPAPRLVLDRRVDGFVLQQLGRRAPKSRVLLQGSLQEGTHDRAAVLCYVLQRGRLFVDLREDEKKIKSWRAAA